MAKQHYLFAVFFIIIASLQILSNKIMNLTVLQSYSPTVKQAAYSLLIVSLFSICYFIFGMKEGFFMDFSNIDNRVLGRNLPRDAIYQDDRGVHFEFDRVGSGACKDGACHAYGIIKGCPGSKLFGVGGVTDATI